MKRGGEEGSEKDRLAKQDDHPRNQWSLLKVWKEGKDKVRMWKYFTGTRRMWKTSGGKKLNDAHK